MRPHLARARLELLAKLEPGRPLFQSATANLNPWTELKVDTKNPDRRPLLLTSGQKDHTMPWALANAAYKRQRRNPGVTEIVEIPNRGHSLTIDSGWHEVAETSLKFVKRFVEGELEGRTASEAGRSPWRRLELPSDRHDWRFRCYSPAMSAFTRSRTPSTPAPWSVIPPSTTRF